MAVMCPGWFLACSRCLTEVRHPLLLQIVHQRVGGMSAPELLLLSTLGRPVSHPFPHTCGVALQMSLFPVCTSGCENSRLGHRVCFRGGSHTQLHTDTHMNPPSLAKTPFISSLENVCVHVCSEAEAGTADTSYTGSYKSIHTPTS